MQSKEDLREFLVTTSFIDSDHSKVIEYARAVVGPSSKDEYKAIALYYAVRDDIRYDPYHLKLDLEHLRASHTLESRVGFCISKAILLAAVCRAEGIPARLGFADVRNHLTTPRLEENMKTDLFVYHGYTEILLNNKWVKATPAFNSSMCELVNVKPLGFDGVNDSLFHPFDTKGHKHLEYVREHGTFSDLPLDDIISSFRSHYPAQLVETMLGEKK